MTSRTWFGGGTERQRVAAGNAVRRGVARWGKGHVEAFGRIRGGRLLIESATDFWNNDAATLRRLQAAVDGTEV
jgi:hypothetical protein